MSKTGPVMSFYGSKYRAARRYPAPTHRRLIEPFAGGAGYALRHADRDVVLVERDPRIARIWRFLIRSKPADILALPLLGIDQHVDELPPCDPDGKELIRTWLQGGSRNGKNHFSTMARSVFDREPVSFWSKACRARLARTVETIHHWTIVEGDYSDAPDDEATWFVDPPYNNKAGRCYTHHRLDYTALGEWCRARRGQVIVCENRGADWLPFRELYQTANGWNGQTKRSVEVVWP